MSFTAGHRSPAASPAVGLDATGKSFAPRRLLDAEGEEALSMRRIAAELGIRGPLAVQALRHKAALETALIADGLQSLNQRAAEIDSPIPGAYQE